MLGRTPGDGNRTGSSHDHRRRFFTYHPFAPMLYGTTAPPMPIIRFVSQTLLDALRRSALYADALRSRAGQVTSDKLLAETSQKRTISIQIWPIKRPAPPERLGRRRLLVRPLAHLVHRRWRAAPLPVRRVRHTGEEGQAFRKLLILHETGQCEPTCGPRPAGPGTGSRPEQTGRLFLPMELDEFGVAGRLVVAFTSGLPASMGVVAKVRVLSVRCC